MARAGGDNLRLWHAKIKADPALKRKMRRTLFIDKVPPHRADDYAKIADKVGGREAVRMILEDEAIKARRAAG